MHIKHSTLLRLLGYAAVLMSLLAPTARASVPDATVRSTVNLPPVIVDINNSPSLPWSEGKGTARRVAGEDLSGGPGNIGWRVEVVSSTEKTALEPAMDIGRSIALIRGRGILVKWAPPSHVAPHPLDELFRPFYFSGNVNFEPLAPGTMSELIELASNGKFFRAGLTPIRDGMVPQTNEVLMVYCADSTLNIEVADHNIAVLKAGQAAIWRNGSPLLRVKPGSQNAHGFWIHVDRTTQ